MSVNTALRTELSLGALGSSSSEYSTQQFLGDQGSPVKQQALALQVPLGSQLNLLDAQMKGNKYLQFSAPNFTKISEKERATFMNPGYNALTGSGDSSYFKFGGLGGAYNSR